VKQDNSLLFLFELKLRNSNNFLIVSWLDRIQLKFIANRNIFVTINLLVLKLIHTCNSCITNAISFTVTLLKHVKDIRKSGWTEIGKLSNGKILMVKTTVYYTAI
jgi:hypothetical protein